MKLSLLNCLKLFCVGVAFLHMSEAKAEAFGFDNVIELAQKNAKVPYQNKALSLPPQLAHLTPAQYSDIRFKRERGAWFGQDLPFEIQLYHPGGLFNHSVQVYEIVDDEVKLIPYDSDDFDFGKNPVSEHILNEKLGYAGFRLHYPLNRSDYFDELISFLGASYFRSMAKGQNYGLSARGLAINTAENVPEEFPLFTKFWLKRPDKNSKSIQMWALLDSESVTGAYQFDIAPKNDETSIRVNAVLFARKDIAKMGVAPLTSMFLYGENTKSAFDDYRPEVHDSDGLLVINGNGEKIWRPLDNSKHLRLSSFVDDNPKGFGLMQRDRNPEHYLDFEANYELRPSAWVEPKGNWGKGTVQLVEIPSIQEIHDNIVAYWIPDEEVEAGKPLQYNYRLYWSNTIPVDTKLAKVTSTYTGIGGVSGMLETNKRKFVVDFDLPGKRKQIRQDIKSGKIVPEVSTSEGKIIGTYLVYNPVTGGATVYADFEPNDKTAELRILLKKDGKTISETWSYQWLP